MQFQFKVTIGSTEITVIETADSQAQFVEKVSFFSGLPTEGPNGETDLKFLHRTTKEGYNYYSIVSEKAGKEYNLGQSQKVPGELFGKGWEDLYVAETTDTAAAGIGAQVAQPVPQQVVQPVAQVVNPLSTTQVVQPLTPTQVVQPVAQVVQPVAQVGQPTTVPVAATPANGAAANQKVANDVLAKFGI